MRIATCKKCGVKFAAESDYCLTQEEAIERERLSDELRALQFTNIAPFDGETYEENLRRRAAISLRRDEILNKLAGF